MLLSPKHLKSKWNKLRFRVKAFTNWYTLIFPINRFLPAWRILKCRNGLKLYVDNIYSSAIGMTREVWENNDYGPLPQQGIVVDIGANIGAFALLASQKTHISVFALEPVAKAYKQLEKNIELNNLQSRIKTVRLALAGEDGIREIYHSRRNMGGNSFYIKGSKSEQVPCQTLKTFMSQNHIERIALLKCDCEGAEYEILLNTPQETFNRIDRIAVEVHAMPDRNFDDLQKFLTKMGFHARWSGSPQLLHATRLY
jgi:FkbM family methyltransferase